MGANAEMWYYWNRFWELKDVSFIQSIPGMEIFRPAPGVFRILQPLWEIALGLENYVKSPLFPIVLSMCLYVVMVMPWVYIDMYGREWKWIQKYKIQPDKPATWAGIRKAMLLTLWNHLLYLLPISVAQWVWTPDTVLPKIAPTLWDFCVNQYLALAVFDFEYYIWHFSHHKVRFLYKHVHGVHHQYHAPHSWVTQYLHPWELIAVGTFATTSPWIFSSHPMTHWSFMQFSMLISVEAHIGYDLPLMPHNWAPFWGGGIKHDMHHQKPLTNFQPFFNWFDRLMGTECPGQRAGGYKPPELLDWEKKHAELRLLKRKELESKSGLLLNLLDDQAEEDLILDPVN